MDTPDGSLVGRVIGTQDATPLEFWVAVGPGEFLQLDDVVALERTPPGLAPVRIYGVVSQVRARQEGAHFDSDVFLIAQGLLPAEVVEAAQVLATRFEPEVFVPPLPGTPVRRARGEEREEALFFDGMRRRLPIGLSRDDEALYANLEFIDGSRGAHVNISGISGVATKTTYATFLLHSLFTSGVLGGEAVNTKALIFNVKGEDLLFLDKDNRELEPEEAARYKLLGLAPGAFGSVSFYAPPKVDSPSASPDVASRATGVTSFFWTLAEFCEQQLIPFLFADSEDDRQQYTMVIHNVAARLKADTTGLDDGGVAIEGHHLRTFRELVDFVVAKLEDEMERDHWAGRAIGQGTINAFIRRLVGSVRHVERMIRGDVANPGRHKVELQSQVTVVDLHNLNDRAKRFVVGVTVKRAFDEKERTGRARPLLFLVLDELNKYAPREGSSPIKEILLDVAERGRSLGVILIGAQQTASEVERRIIANSAIRVVGRLDGAEAGRDEYRFLPGPQRQRATIIKPGTMIVNQPELPIPLVVEFPFPAWATRPSEAAGSPGEGPDDPFDGIPTE
ncbi:MAG TPA: ATP-binding protein [Actinomycetota bacterium]